MSLYNTQKIALILRWVSPRSLSYILALILFTCSQRYTELQTQYIDVHNFYHWQNWWQFTPETIPWYMISLTVVAHCTGCVWPIPGLNSCFGVTGKWRLPTSSQVFCLVSLMGKCNVCVECMHLPLDQHSCHIWYNSSQINFHNILSILIVYTLLSTQPEAFTTYGRAY